MISSGYQCHYLPNIHAVDEEHSKSLAYSLNNVLIDQEEVQNKQESVATLAEEERDSHRASVKEHTK